jgi:hypothetical protein
VVRALDLAAMHEQQLSLGLAHHDPIRWRELIDRLCFAAGADRDTGDGQHRRQTSETHRSQAELGEIGDLSA